MERTRWWSYVERLMDAAGWSKADLSRASEVDQSVIGRWQSKGAAPEPPTVRAVARAFGRDVREAAIAAELFTAAELMGRRKPVIDPETFDLSVISNERIRDEIYARMEHGHNDAAKSDRARTRQRDAAHADRTSIPASPGRDSTVLHEEPLPAPPGDVECDGGEVTGSSARPA